MNTDELFIQRTCDLARLGGAKVSPNPMVGAVIVADNKIIGEGYHQAYGTPHAEVNAVKSVKPEDKHLLNKSKIYVSLEPCCIQGKTPPCTDLILDQKIPEVVISALDRSPDVNGKSVEILERKGVGVQQKVLPQQGKLLSQPRTTFVTQMRPYIILKFAQTTDGFMATRDQKQFWISNAYTSRLTHKWRSEVNAIMVGKRTAQIDNPSLTTRYYFGNDPVRVVLDKNLSLDGKLQVFDGKVDTLIFNGQKNEQSKNLEHIKLDFDDQLLPNILSKLYEKKISILMVEGGPTLLNAFLEQGLWDEARIITGAIEIKEGLKAPLPPGDPAKKFMLGSDEIAIYFNRSN